MTPALRAALALLPRIKHIAGFTIDLEERCPVLKINESETLIAALEELKDMAVVPREPTEAMMNAGFIALTNPGDVPWKTRLLLSYRAMIAEGEKEAP